MKSLRKSILTLLALTLFGGAGAWAQGPTQVTQFTTDLIADWQGVNEAVTLADLQALGFVAVAENTAAAWTGAPQDGYAWLIYDFDEGYCDYMLFEDGIAGPSYSSYTKSYLYDMASSGYKFFYTGAPNPEPAAIELTKAGANQWSLGQAPDYDLELQVEYYEAHALKNIPAGWTVLINGHDSTSRIVEGSLNITETDTVTLVPDGNPRRVKSVTLEDDVVRVNIGGITLDITGCTYWSEIITRNPGKIWDEGGWIGSNSGILVLGGSVYPDHPYYPDQQSSYHWLQ